METKVQHRPRGDAAKTLVTGSTGLAGSALVERLVPRGYEVRAPARNTSGLSHTETTGAEIVFGGITVYDTLPPAVKGMDLVFHCAAKVTPGWGNWNEYGNTTVRGTGNVLRASTEAGAERFPQVSSYTVNSEACAKGDIPADESTPGESRKTPPTFRDYSKLLAEQACWESHRQGKIQMSMLRIGSAYSPRERLLADRRYKQTSFPILMSPGSANPRYAIVHVSDMAELAILAATSDKAIGQACNIAGPQPASLKEFAEALIRARGVRRT